MAGEILPGGHRFGSAERYSVGLTLVMNGQIIIILYLDSWHNKFPSGAEINKYLPSVAKFRSKIRMILLIERRNAEYSLFRKIEEIHVLEQVKAGFDSVDSFIDLANSVSNRRKSRSGKSLELHLETLFTEQSLTTFSTQCVTEEINSLILSFRLVLLTMILTGHLNDFGC